MIGFRLSEVAELLHGRLLGGDAFFDRIGTDTRSLQGGELFVAIRGVNFDGHDFLAGAAQRGAVGALVDRDVEAPLPLVRVDDALRGLGGLASAWRARCPATVIGITGSNGKTTLKEMCAVILGCEHRVLATQGNLNNHIGVPLTLARLQDEQFAVIEMGANHAGEIRYLSKTARPDVAVLNNAGRAHLEGFGSLDGVAHAKAEIIEGLRAGGTFVFNGDDRYAGLWRELAGARRQLTFGVRNRADIASEADSYRIEWGEQGYVATFAVTTPQDGFEVSLQLAGEHNRMNALAAIAACHAVGIPPAQMQAGLAQLAPVAGRLAPVRAHSGARVIDDSYNANPESVIAALGVLRAAPGRRTLVLGDLGELGAEQEQMHRELGQRAAEAGIERLFSCGELSRHASQAFAGESRHFDTREALIDHLGSSLGSDDSVLIKGSRTSLMDRVVVALRAEEQAC
jgi:UDP-N-acetylmuramoyl-tripeptide--D-alanyl-D-alanine ligase